MSYSYTLRNLQTSEEYYTGLSAGEVHQITGISFNNVSRYAAQKEFIGMYGKCHLMKMTIQSSGMMNCVCVGTAFGKWSWAAWSMAKAHTRKR